MKSEVTFFQSLSWLFQLTYFVKCKRTPLELNFCQPYPSSQRERKFCHCLFTSFIKREIRHFHVVVVQWRQRNVQKSVMHVQSCFFALSSYSFFYFLVAAASYTWYYLRYVVIRQKQNFLSANWIAPADSIRNVFRLSGSSFVSV